MESSSYFLGVLEAHARDVARLNEASSKLNEASSRVDISPQWNQAIEYMQSLEMVVSDLTKILSGILNQTSGHPTEKTERIVQMLMEEIKSK